MSLFARPDRPSPEPMPGSAEGSAWPANIHSLPLQVDNRMALLRSTFERAAAAARIGVWHCDLPSERLTWTDTVYDLFGLPRDAPLVRSVILNHYPDRSAALLERVRSRAIRERSGFRDDFEIRTAKGETRWLRITATVEHEGGRPARIFGLKQDVTEEREEAGRLRHRAENDLMTGLANRATFQGVLDRFDDPLDELNQAGFLLIADLDGFKQINDTFGHGTGDECIRTAARQLAAMCPDAVVVARIGGDEFAAVFRPQPVDAIRRRAAAIVERLGTWVTRGGISLPLGASIGIAEARGGSATELFRIADSALYAAKSAGRNTFRIAR